MEEVTVIIPAYKRLVLLLKKLPIYLRSVKNKEIPIKEVFIIAEKEKPSIIKKANFILNQFNDVEIRFISPKKRLGKGGAVVLGAIIAKTEHLIIIDADLPITPEELSKMYWLHLVSGSPVFCYRRIYKTSSFRKMLSKMYRILNRLLYEEAIDTQCGVKILTKQQLLSYPLIASWGFLYDTILYKKMHCDNNRVMFMPVNYLSEKEGELDNPWKLLLLAHKTLVTTLPWLFRKIFGSKC